MWWKTFSRAHNATVPLADASEIECDLLANDHRPGIPSDGRTVGRIRLVRESGGSGEYRNPDIGIPAPATYTWAFCVGMTMTKISGTYTPSSTDGIYPWVVEGPDIVSGDSKRVVIEPTLPSDKHMVRPDLLSVTGDSDVATGVWIGEANGKIIGDITGKRPGEYVFVITMLLTWH